MLSLTKDELMALRPCDLKSRLPLFNGDEPLTVLAALEKGVNIPDLLWAAAKMGRRGLCVRFALLCAQRVAHLSADPRVQRCLDAVAAWLEDPSEKNRMGAAGAAHAAHAAAAAHAAHASAYAAYAADASAYAADAAAYTACIAGASAYAADAADAADASAYAADAADAADASAYAAHYVAGASAGAAEIEAQREIFISVFCS